MWFFDDLPFGGSGWLQRKAFICMRATTERLHPSIIKHHGHRKIGIWGVMPIDLAWIQRSLLQGRWKKTFLSVQNIVFKNKLSLTEFLFWNKSSWSWNTMESLFQHLSCLFCRYFQEFTSKLPWTKARRHCRALGGRLISVNDRDASYFIYKTFKKYVNPFLMKWVRECVKLWNLILKCVNITSPWYKVFWPSIRNWLTSF